MQRLPVTCASTGVKHLHHAAAERYDIGVYFEANGHGTVLFSLSARRKIASHKPSTAAQATALGRLKDVIDVINQTVGDALSDMLLVEVALYHMSYSVETWDKLYSDLPNRLVKVKVGDRNAFVTEDAERRLVRPLGLQAKIDRLVQRTGGRSFVRPSGTEDVVRVYAEAQETDDVIGKRPVLNTHSPTNFVVQILPSVSPDSYTMRRVETLRRGRRTLGDIEGQNLVNLTMCACTCTWGTSTRLVSCK
jgi:phosphoacetylglucosamine mutase